MKRGKRANPNPLNKQEDLDNVEEYNDSQGNPANDSIVTLSKADVEIVRQSFAYYDQKTKKGFIDQFELKMFLHSKPLLVNLDSHWNQLG